MEELIELDKQIFLGLNSLHAPWLDQFMFFISQSVAGVPLYLFLLFIVLKNFKSDSWAPLLGILLTILIADQTNTAILKPLFERLRPSHEPSLDGLVHVVNGYTGGLYGFASSHASNTLGLALFFWMLFKHQHKWIIFLFAWPLIVSYSRIYLGVHYPGDVMAGWIVGMFAALVGFRFFLWLNQFTKKSREAL